MKKYFSYLLLLSLTVFFVAACSSGDEATTSDTSTTPKYIVDFQVRADADSNQVTLEWYMDPDAETYNIRYLEDDGTKTRPDYTKMKAVTPIKDIKSAPYTVTGLKANTTYWFSVSGVNSIQESYLWLPVKSSTTNSPPPPAPEDVRPNPEDTKVTINWKPVIASPAITSYKLYCYWQEGLNAGVGQTITIDGQSSNSKVVDSVYWVAGTEKGKSIAGTTTALTNGRTYYFYVTAVNSIGESSPSFTVYGTPSKTPPPFAPVLITATAGSTSLTQILLQWTTVTGEGDVTYKIYYGPAKGITKGTGFALSAGDTNQGYMTDLTKGLPYYFVVTAIDDNGESAESNEMSVTPTVD